MIRAVIVDDEFHAREELSNLLSEIGSVEVVAVCANAPEAIKAVNRERPDVLFLDIHMPLIDGFELVSMLDDSVMPHLVFVTAYDEYALKAFEENTLAYLLKPVDKPRLERAIAKIKEHLRGGEAPNRYPRQALGRIPCVGAKRIKLIDLADVEAVRSEPSGIYLNTDEGDFFTDLTLKVIEEQTELVRCHRQYLVNLAKIDEIALLDGGMGEIRTFSGSILPVSRRYLRELKEHLGL